MVLYLERNLKRNFNQRFRLIFQINHCEKICLAVFRQISKVLFLLKIIHLGFAQPMLHRLSMFDLLAYRTFKRRHYCKN